MRWKIAFRNTFRNRRRTLINVFMIAGGVSAIILFEGFALNLVIALRETTIKTQTGHLQIASPQYWDKTAKTAKEALLPPSDKLVKEIKRHPSVKSVAGKLAFYSLLGLGDMSLSARGVTWDSSAEGPVSKIYTMTQGKGFTGNGFHIVIGSGLAARLRAKPKDRVTVLAHTYDGVVNAVDVEITGIFQTAIAEFDDSTFLIPLAVAQKLMDTNRVEQLIVNLKNTEMTDDVLGELRERIGAGARIEPWYVIAKLYNQVAAFNRVQNRVVEFIILTLILLAILNTIGMSIFERTGEIGTIAALGETSRTILFQFVMEGFILGLIGSLSGVLLGVLVVQGVNAAQIAITMPGASGYYTLKIELYAGAFRDGAILSVFAAVIAAFIPALRASKMNIAEALRRNV